MNNVSNFNSWRRPKVNPTACSQTGCSGLAPAPELCPYGAPAAATSPCRAFMNKPQPFFSTLTLISFLLNLTHTTLAGPFLSLWAHGNARFPIQTTGQRPGGLKAISYRSVTVRKSVVPVDTEAVSTAGSLLFKCGLSMMGFRTAR